MTNEEISSRTAEFQQAYERQEAPTLPKELSNYQFVSCLTDSGQKKTWLLKKASGRKVLCKYAAGEYIEMLRTENSFDSLGKFSFVPYIIDYFETGNAAYLLREYIEGPTLSDLVEKEGVLPLNRVLPLIEQLCNHLSRLHASVPPIIYRDLKPSNIVLHPSGDCYLIDMGAVRTYHEDHSLDTVFIGTVGTAAPEQFGARQTDNRTDIYALGVLFYYLLTGDTKIQENQLKKLSGKASSVIRKCTAFAPEDRYSQVSEVAAALRPPVRSKAGLAAVSASLGMAVALLVLYPLIRTAHNTPVSEDSLTKNSIVDVSAMNDSLPESPMPEDREPTGPAEITFTSSLLEQAVRDAIDKTNGEPVYEEDLSRITELDICGTVVFRPEEAQHSQYPNIHSIQGQTPEYGDITDISLLAKMPNLHYVVLDYQKIYDLSPLEDLTLVSLSLCGNPIVDLSPLAGQKSLTDLYVAETGAVSVEPLQECSALSTLDISNTSVAVLAPIQTLPIHILYMMGTPARDFETLSATPLHDLYCRGVSAEYFDSIQSIASLQGLTLYQSDITSLKEISCFSRLSRLDVHDNPLTDLDGLAQFTNLTNFSTGMNPITDLSPLAKMRNIAILNICTTEDVDFSVLNEMPLLQIVTINPSQADALYEAVPEPWFSVVFQ